MLYALKTIRGLEDMRKRLKKEESKLRKDLQEKLQHVQRENDYEDQNELDFETATKLLNASVDKIGEALDNFDMITEIEDLTTKITETLYSMNRGEMVGQKELDHLYNWYNEIMVL